MIAIIRKEKFTDKDREYTYYVQINEVYICKFKHKYSDGLEKCLAKASKAVKSQKESYEAKLFRLFKDI